MSLHDVGVCALASDKYSVAFASEAERCMNSFAPIHYDMGLALHACFHCLKNCARVFIIWVFVCKDHFRTCLVSDPPHLRSLPRIAPAACVAKHANLAL